MKKFIIILSFILLFLIFFSVRKQDSYIRIVFASWGSESEIKILKPIFDDFEKKNKDIKIEFMHIPQNYFQKIHLLYASNTSPDVIFVNNQYLPVYANAGLLLPLDEYDNIFHFEKYFDKSLQSMKWRGKLYAIPRDISNLVIFYNKDIFSKYSIPYPQPNWSYDEFISTALKLKKHNIFGISFEEDPLYFIPYLNLYQGWTENDTNNYFKKDILYNNRIKNGLGAYADLRYRYHVAPLKSDIGSATNAQMFLNQQIGMYLSGRWMVPKLRQDAKFDWDIIEFPSLKKGEISQIASDSSGWAISKSSKHKKEALKFVEFLSSQTNIEKITQSGLIVPARIDVSNSKVFLDNQRPKHSQYFLNSAKNSVPTPVTLDYREILDDLKIKTEPIFNRH